LIDADGDLFVTGRVDDMIITGGENVSPVEIESCLSLHPAVSEVAVAGLPHERWGKIVCAFVKRRAAVERANSTPTAAAPRCPISSARAATCSSPRSQNLPSASFCAASSWPAITRRSAAPP
jgi:acyl-CoA synthetase (AMP-forming)/AMP-acid ligase II